MQEFWKLNEYYPLNQNKSVRNAHYVHNKRKFMHSAVLKVNVLVGLVATQRRLVFASNIHFLKQDLDIIIIIYPK